MILTTTETIPNKKVKEILGVVRGNTIRTRNVGVDILSQLKHIIGGELKGYSTMITQARDEAYDRLQEEGEKLGADAIINIRFVTAEVMPGAAEILCYGTAVRLK
jgi:uncharacterized protein YbjQ (UPF0145 family)